jgi:dihydrodipicolinate synthase/N-acetylneuraminate lyase
MSQKLLKGIIVPTITPLTQQGTLDKAGVGRLVDHLLDGDINGLFLAGTTGEGPALSYQIRRELVANVCKQINGRIPVVIAALDSSPAETLNMISHAADAGAVAAAVAPPFYMPLSQTDIIRYVETISQRSPLPLYLYNVPNANLPRFSLEALDKLSQLDNVRGFKDSTGCREFLLDAIRIFSRRPDSSVLVGPEELLIEALRAGADGGVSGGANLFPELYRRTYDAAVVGDWRKAEQLHRLILRVDKDFYRVGEAESALIRGVKVAAGLLGLCNDTIGSPYSPATPEQIRDVAQKLDRFQMALQEAFA